MPPGSRGAIWRLLPAPRSRLSWAQMAPRPDLRHDGADTLETAMTSELAELRDQILALSGRYAELAHGAKPFVAGSSAVPPSGKVLGPQEMRFLVDSCLD